MNKFEDSTCQSYNLSHCSEYIVYCFKKQNQLPAEIQASSAVFLLLEHSESLSSENFNSLLRSFNQSPISQRVHYWHLFLVLCDFTLILDCSFSNNQSGSHFTILIDCHSFVILELMFYLYIKVLNFSDKTLKTRMQGKLIFR